VTDRSRAFSRAVEAVASALVLAALLAAAIAVRGHTNPGDNFALSQPVTSVGLAAGAATGLTPPELTQAAAVALEAAHAKGFGGITFEIVQTATLHAKAGGPKIDLPDPNSRGSLGLADQYQVGSVIERGTYTSDGFWMEMRDGPTGGEKPDFEHATYQFGAIAKSGKTYRNDGDGWYATDQPPGIGLDPTTAALLPSLLRNAANPIDAGTDLIGASPVREVAAAANVADVPGIVAVDGKEFTSITSPVTFAFDDQGRLVRLSVTAKNTNETVYDLFVETEITFAYPSSAPPIPDPAPTAPPAAAAPKG
jgi:hypothetical protein